MTAMSLLGIYLQEWKSAYKRDTWASMFIAALFPVAKIGISPGAQQPING
jgi:hypothetical protein